MLSGLKRKIGKPGVGAGCRANSRDTAGPRVSAGAEQSGISRMNCIPVCCSTPAWCATLGRHCAEVEQHHHVKVIFSVVNDLDRLSPDLALCLFRVAQEALGNAVRHSRAHTIT